MLFTVCTMISLKQLVGKTVTIVIEGNEVVGKLVSFQPAKRKNHIPSILVVVRNGEQYIIIKNWKLVKMNPIISYVTKVTINS